MAHDDIPPPTGWADFEDFCLHLWRLRWNDDNARKHGRLGQKQCGVDVYGRTADGKRHGVQCKVKSQILGKQLSKAEIEKEVEDAKTFEPPLASLTLATTAPSDVGVEEIIRKISDRQTEEGSFPVHYKSWHDLLEDCYDKNHPERLDLLKQHRDRWLNAGPPQVDTTHLPITGKHFLGRLAELETLDTAWADDHKNVLSIVAWGGVGKTALVKYWLDAMRKDDWRGAKRVFAWTFYSQGTRQEGKEGEDGMASAEPCFEKIYRWLNVDMPTGPRERGLRLAELLRERRTLLYLDGVEPLQHPPGSGKEGQLRDPGLQAFLKSWATTGDGLCVVTTREKLTDLQDAGVEELNLSELEPDSAVALLTALGVHGAKRDLRDAADKFGHHALALTLLGNYLARVESGNVNRISEIDFGEAQERQGGHAFRVMHAYEKWLEPREFQVLRLLGLFDRTAPGGAVAALRQEPAIAGLTDEVVGLSESDWRWAVGSLREHGLLAGEDPADPEALDAHPLVREYFGERLREENEEAWRAGHERLYEYYKGAAPEYPDTLQQMLPLYAAVVHGCRAGREEEVFDEVYKRRILQIPEHFSWKMLGAFGVELTALAAFFDRTWNQPSTHLSVPNRNGLLNEAAMVLRAQGRLTEAMEPLRAAATAASSDEDWEHASIGTSNLSELILTLGEVDDAVATGELCVELADRSGVALQRVFSRTTLATALHQANRYKESAASFHTAEGLLAEWRPHQPRLYSLGGYQYCDLVLSEAEPEEGAGLDGLIRAVTESEQQKVENCLKACENVKQRAACTIEIAEKGRWLLEVALDNLSLGRAYLRSALIAPAGTADITAARHLDQAVAGLRRAALEEEIPRGLLARAAFRRLLGNHYLGATADLDEAQEIAERGSMKLHLADTHLERTRLHLFQFDDPATARLHFVEARRLVEECGYGRRDREVRWLGERLREAGETTTA